MRRAERIAALWGYGLLLVLLPFCLCFRTFVVALNSALKADRVYLHVEEDNEVAGTLYQELGYTEVRRDLFPPPPRKLLAKRLIH